MKKNSLSFFSIFLFPVLLFSNSKVDSLLHRVKNTTGEEKAKTCLLLSNTLRFSDQGQANFYGKEGLAIAKELSLKNLQPKLEQSLAIVHTIQGNYEKAKDYYNEAIEGFRKTDNARGVGRVYSNLGLTNERQGNYQSAMENYNKAKLLFETLADTSSLMLVKGNIGNIAYHQGDYEKALPIYEEMLNWGYENDSKKLIARYLGNIGRVYLKKGNYPDALRNYYKSGDMLDNKSEQANLYNDIGLIYLNLRMFEQSLYFFEKGLDLYEKIGNKRQMGMIHTNICKQYIFENNLEKARFHIQKALLFYEESGTKSIGNLLQNLAIVHLKQEEYDSAVLNLKKAVEVALELDQKNILGSSYSNLGTAYFEKGDLENAEFYQLKAESILEELGDIQNLKFNSECLASIYETNQKFEKALKYKERVNLFKDSLFGIEKANEIIRIEVEEGLKNNFELKENVQSDSTKKESNSLMIWGGAGLFGLLVFFVYRFLADKNETETHLKEILKLAESEKLILEEELEKKNLEMTFLSLSMVQKDKFLQELKTDLVSFSKKHPDNREVRQLIQSVHFQDVTKKDWENFKSAYEQVFPSFFDELFNQFPKLSSKELRHCALIRLKIPLPDIADILGISVNSIHKARHRLRTKFGLERSQKLEEFISNF